MNREKLARVALIVFAIAQLPFAVIGVTLAIGLISNGPAYFLISYDLLARSGYARPLSGIPIEQVPGGLRMERMSDGLITERPPEGDRAQSRAQPEPLAGQILERPATEIPSIEALAPRTPPADRTVLWIAGLPAYDPVSGYGLGLADVPGLAVDYVSVPPARSKYGTDHSPVRLKFRPAEAPRVLVLAGQPGLSWQFEGDVPAGIIAVLVAAPDATGDETLFGLPDSIPALRIGTGRKELPFLHSALPDCAVKADPRRPFNCSNVAGNLPGRYRTPFEAAEHRVQVLLGADIATVSAAFADDTDRVILVPEEIVDRAIRDRARSYVERYDEAVQSESRHREILKDYARRWVEDRRSAVIDEVALHPPYVSAELAGKQPDVLIVSAHQGATKERQERADRRHIRTYQEFVDQQAGKVGSIVVEVTAREPTVIVATASRAVDWRFEFSQGAKVLAVHVEGPRAPTVTGVPRDVPLTVRSNAYGDRKVAAQVKILTDQDATDGESQRVRADLERFRDMYPGSALVIYGKYTLDRARLSN